MSKKAIVTAVILVVLCIGGIAAFIIMRSISVEAPAAEIYVDGTLYKTVDLSAPTSFTVTTEHGYNEICVSDGKISVVAADCPDKVCVNSGWINGGAVPIICLPHRLEIRIVSKQDDIDAQIQ